SRSATKNALSFCAAGEASTANNGAAAPDRGMLYQAYHPPCDLVAPMRAFAGSVAASAARIILGWPEQAAIRNLTAAYELIARAGLTHERAPFGIDRVSVGNREVAVRERAARVTPFA